MGVSLFLSQDGRLAVDHNETGIPRWHALVRQAQVFKQEIALSVEFYRLVDVNAVRDCAVHINVGIFSKEYNLRAVCGFKPLVPVHLAHMRLIGIAHQCAEHTCELEHAESPDDVA